MKKKFIMLTAIVTLGILLVAISGVSNAAVSEQKGGIHVGSGDSDSHIAVVETIGNTDGFNVDESVNTGFSYSSDWIGLKYTPTISYNLKKVELIAGSGTGNFIIQLRTDNYGKPGNTILRENSFNMVEPVSWQGVEFTAWYPLTAGTTYWIVFKPIPGSQASIAQSGAIITHAWDYGSDGWDGVRDYYPWMAKFYEETEKNPTVLISTDKAVYVPGETMQLKMSISNPTENTYVSNIGLDILWPTGVGMKMFSKSFTMNPGINVVKVFPFPIPNSVPNGDYKLTATLSYDGISTTSSASFTINRV